MKLYAFYEETDVLLQCNLMTDCSEFSHYLLSRVDISDLHWYWQFLGIELAPGSLNGADDVLIEDKPRTVFQ